MNKSIEIIIVSFDINKHDYIEHIEDMPWYAIPYSSNANNIIKSYFSHIHRIPYIAIVNSNQDILSYNGIELVQSINLSSSTNHNPNTLIQQHLSTLKVLSKANKPIPSSVANEAYNKLNENSNRIWPALGRLAFFSLVNESNECITKSQVLEINNVQYASRCGLYLNGLYGTIDAYTVQTKDLLSDYNEFSLCIDFFMASTNQIQWLLVAGLLTRFLGVKININGQLYVTLKNQSIEYLLFNDLQSLQWYTLCISFSSSGINCTLNQQMKQIKFKKVIDLNQYLNQYKQRDDGIITCVNL